MAIQLEKAADTRKGQGMSGHKRELIMLIVVLLIIVSFDPTRNVGLAQKEAADSDWYPLGYGGST